MSDKISFEQYHDEDGVFHKEFKLTFGQCNKNQKILLSQLLLLTCDTAVEDYRQLGYSWEMLCEHHMFILMSRLSLHVLKMPVTNQCITIETWEEKPDGIQLNRKYRIVDSDSGEVLINGSSSWMVVNTESRRIIPAKKFTLRPAPDKQTEYDGLPLGKIVIPEDCKHLDNRVIRFSDVDANGHTNNSRYGDFIIDALPEDLQNEDFSDIRINYSHEAVLGETLDISAAYKDNEIIVAGKHGNDTCFECILVKRG